jgi:ABC-2 type transport system ATP-binding protein
MPEAAAIVPMLKGVEFVAFAGDLYGMPHRDARRRAHEVLNYVGLGELRYRRLEEYSTGNLQRLKLAAALVHDPQLLLLDEPTNGLDPAGRAAMLQLLEDLIAETGKSVILCTHLLGDVERLCRQIVVLDRGTVVRAGTMDEMRAQINNRYQLSWSGDSQAFRAKMQAAGIEFTDPEELGQSNIMVAVPGGFQMHTFFQLAQASGAVLTELKADEENLERLFFRVTGQEAPLTPA